MYIIKCLDALITANKPHVALDLMSSLKQSYRMSCFNCPSVEDSFRACAVNYGFQIRGPQPRVLSHFFFFFFLLHFSLKYFIKPPVLTLAPSH